MQEYYYIQNGDIIITDYELTLDKYVLGTTLEEYSNGAYVKLNEEQIQYYKNNQKASPEEIFNRAPVNYTVRVQTPEMKALLYMEDEIHYVLINGEKLQVLNWSQLLDSVRLSEDAGKLEVVLEIGFYYYKTSVGYAKKMLSDIEVFEKLIKVVAHRHIKYLELHPTEADKYDYTTGYPEFLSFTLEKIDSNPNNSELLKNSEILTYAILKETLYFNDSKKFKLNDEELWLDSEQRSSLKNLAEIQVKQGKDTISFWGNKIYEIPYNIFIEMINKIEDYSSKCYIIYQQRKAKVELEVNNGIELENINNLSEYPSILEFTINA